MKKKCLKALDKGIKILEVAYQELHDYEENQEEIENLWQEIKKGNIREVASIIYRNDIAISPSHLEVNKEEKGQKE